MGGKKMYFYSISKPWLCLIHYFRDQNMPARYLVFKKNTNACPAPQHLFLWKNVWICVGSFSLKERCLLTILSLRSQAHVRSPLNPAASWFFCFTPLILECWGSSLTLIGTFKEKSKKKEKNKRPPLVAKVRDPKVKVLKNYSEILKQVVICLFQK